MSVVMKILNEPWAVMNVEYVEIPHTGIRITLSGKPIGWLLSCTKLPFGGWTFRITEDNYQPEVPFDTIEEAKDAILSYVDNVVFDSLSGGTRRSAHMPKSYYEKDYQTQINREIEILGEESKKSNKLKMCRWDKNIKKVSFKDNKRRKYKKYLAMVTHGKVPKYKRVQKLKKRIKLTWTETWSKPVTKFFDEWLKMMAGSDIVVPPAGIPSTESVVESMFIDFEEQNVNIPLLKI